MASVQIKPAVLQFIGVYKDDFRNFAVALSKDDGGTADAILGRITASPSMSHIASIFGSSTQAQADLGALVDDNVDEPERTVLKLALGALVVTCGSLIAGAGAGALVTIIGYVVVVVGICMIAYVGWHALKKALSYLRAKIEQFMA